MAKLSTMTLEELYARPTLTKTVRIAIAARSDFSKIDPLYCEKVCTLKCKDTEAAILQRTNVDVLFVQDHQAPKGKFDKDNTTQEAIQYTLISKIATAAGMNSLKYRVTSLLKCPPSDEDFPAGKPPSNTTLHRCSPYLFEEINFCKPKVIVSLGTASTKALGLPKHSNTGNRGQIAIGMNNIPVVITLHPKIMTYIRQNARGAAGMWGPDYLKVIENDFHKAVLLAEKDERGKTKLIYNQNTLKESVGKLLNDQISIARNLTQVQELMQGLWALPTEQVVSFDTETTSLDPLDPKLKLLSIQFGWMDGETLRAIVIPLWHRANQFYSPDAAWEFIKPYLESDRPKVGHKSKYDILVIYWSKGVRVKNVKFDTLLLLHSIYSGAQGTYGLKSAVWDYLPELGIGGYEDQLGDLKALKKQIEEAQGEIDPDVLQADAGLNMIGEIGSGDVT